MFTGWFLNPDYLILQKVFAQFGEKNPQDFILMAWTLALSIVIQGRPFCLQLHIYWILD